MAPKRPKRKKTRPRNEIKGPGIHFVAKAGSGASGPVPEIRHSCGGRTRAKREMATGREVALPRNERRGIYFHLVAPKRRKRKKTRPRNEIKRPGIHFVAEAEEAKKFLRDSKKLVPLQSQRGNSSVGRARPCQGRGREFESRFPLQMPT